MTTIDLLGTHKRVEQVEEKLRATGTPKFDHKHENSH